MSFSRMVCACVFNSLVPQNKNLVLYMLNYGNFLWAGVFWVSVGAMMVLGSWRKQGPYPTRTQLGRKYQLFSVNSAFEEKVF
jgi:hypothetical protein